MTAPVTERRAHRGQLASFFLAAAATTAGLAVAARSVLGQVDESDPGTVLAALAAAAGCAVAAWLSAVSGLYLAATVPGRLGRTVGQVADRVTPALLRQGLALAIGTSSVAVVLPGATVSASAALPDESPGAPGSERASDSARAAPDPAWRPAAPTAVPDPSWQAPVVAHETARPPVPSAPSAGWTPQRPRPVHQPDLDVLGGRLVADDEPGYVVRRGDCLWDVVARHLGTRATAADVAAALPRWYETNRAVIGDDPDLVLPGTTLHAPATAERTTR